MSATPILDLQEPPPAAPRRWLARLIGIVLGSAIGLVIVLVDEGELPNWHWPGFNGLLIVPLLYAAVAFHEVGHLLAAKLVGIDNGGIAVGGFTLTKSGKNWVFRFNRHLWAYGFFKPLTRSPGYSPSRYAWMVAGGPVASFFLAGMCAVLYSCYGSGPWHAIGSLFWTSAFLGICSLIPINSGPGKSDGALLFLLLRHPERMTRWMALLALQTEETNGVRPRDWSTHFVEQIVGTDVSASEYLLSQLMLYYRYLDEGAEELALEHLENALARSSSAKIGRHAIFLEAASASALHRKNAAQARVWRDRACKLHKPESLHAVEAGIAMCEGRYAEAQEHWIAAREHAARRGLDSGLSRFAQEKWREYEEACQAMNSAHSL